MKKDSLGKIFKQSLENFFRKSSKSTWSKTYIVMKDLELFCYKTKEDYEKGLSFQKLFCYILILKLEERDEWITIFERTKREEKVEKLKIYHVVPFLECEYL